MSKTVSAHDLHINLDPVSEALAARLNNEYAGKVGNIIKASADPADFERRLAAFDGIGPKIVEIFRREAAKVLF